MTTLYRCRTSLCEVAELFDAVVPARAEWSAELWPQRSGLAVYRDGDRRVAAPMRWGIPAWMLSMPAKPNDHVTTVWFRELFRDRSAWLEPERRCLIVMDSFAYPGGEPGGRTRTWFGMDDRPIFAWAGIWSRMSDGDTYCGILAPANALIEPGQAMPAIVDPREYETWLTGDLVSASPVVRRIYPEVAMFRESLDEPWGGSPNHTATS